jgi:integrase
MNATMRQMGYTRDEVPSHGFRTTASTILKECGYNQDVIEAVLGHQPRNTIRRTYNRATYWPERTKLLQEWADILDELRRPKASPCMRIGVLVARD